ncbi:hypothetical protein [Streptomyces sp. NPDC093589]|uniref:hypothetical protein n=1 Tax=Streptomyces sp. NPDC093589 TaxID=3366043 RepID=UPI00380800BF
MSVPEWADSTVPYVELSCVKGVRGRRRRPLLDPADDDLLVTRAADVRADATGWPTLPGLFQLLWRRELSAEGMAVELLGSRTVVRLVGGGIG